jgi:hypothetical protein
VKVRKEYIDKLRQLNKEDLIFDNFKIIQKNILFINPCYKEVLLENVTRIDFTSLYPNLLISLFDEGLIDEKWKEDINRVRWFLKNAKDLKRLSITGSTEYEKWKIHCNSLYIKIKSTQVTSYLDLFYDNLIRKYSDSIIYIDVDLLILNFNKVEFQTKRHIEEIYDFDFDISFINYFYIENNKKYFIQDEFGEVSISGFNNPRRHQVDLFVKSLIREKKLQKIGI